MAAAKSAHRPPWPRPRHPRTGHSENALRRSLSRKQHRVGNFAHLPPRPPLAEAIVDYNGCLFWYHGPKLWTNNATKPDRQARDRIITQSLAALVAVRWFQGATKMNRCAVIVALAIGSSFPSLADDQPSRKSEPFYSLRLSDIMIATQLRHFKLWDAGRLKNWGLANYELAQIRASLQDATRLEQNTPPANTRTQPADDVASAIEEKDSAKFAEAFNRFTLTCNSCHQATGFGFITIRSPRLSPLQTSPFSNEAFSPR
jgi:hypothetical protein